MRELVSLATAFVFLFCSTSIWLPDQAAAQVGIASYYKYGRRTANGERFNPKGLTAAHRTLRFGTRVRVTHLKTGKSVIVRINDRGPFTGGRIIDLSSGAAAAVGLKGTAKVNLTVLD